jgi:hypothetical protein
MVESQLEELSDGLEDFKSKLLEIVKKPSESPLTGKQKVLENKLMGYKV